MSTYVEATRARGEPGLPGTLFEAEGAGNAAHILRAIERGAVLLPVDRDLVERPRNGVDGWALRCFGRGAEPPPIAAGRFCPIAVWTDPARGWIHWAAELRGADPSGHLSLVSDTSQLGTISASGGRSDAIEIDRLAFEIEGRDGDAFAIARGVLRAGVSAEGLLGLSLYGAGSGFVVVRLAVSVCSRDA